MTAQVFIVEDEFLIALSIEDAVLGLGLEVAGMAASRAQALLFEQHVDIALVDVNLLDGQTGPDIGQYFADKGAYVVFMTGNPEVVAKGIPGAVGYMSKPVFDLDLVSVIRYLADRLIGRETAPPRTLSLFAQAA
jgi:DNA-binding LytR/AlgR family response regulator